MKFKQIKDLSASAVGFGCWAIGGTWNNVTDDESVRAIRAAIDAGINFFDVAPVYGKGHAETVLGKALQHEKRHEITPPSVVCHGHRMSAKKRVRI